VKRLAGQIRESVVGAAAPVWHLVTIPTYHITLLGGHGHFRL
jgi:hypothetical protein